MEWIYTTWYGTTLICILSVFFIVLISSLLYRQFFKRFYDMLLSGIALIILLPFFIIFTPIVAIAMKGNPFFTQSRPGKNEKIFKLIKYRTMTNKKDKEGNLLPDEMRMTKFGKFIRKTSLDELPELINIFLGHMSIVGPRPLLIKYLSLYNDEQKHRHDVRPGLTGWAQVNGRNAISWTDRFKLDVEYINKLSLFLDIKILLLTVLTVVNRKGITSETSVTMEVFTGEN